MSNLLNKIESLPESFGVYQFFDKSGKVLYVGKAKSLKKRVKSYFKFRPTLSPNSNLSLRIEKMVLQISSLEYILTDSEADALILENSLIKQLKPKYNILLRDDKSYPYIYVDLDESFPRFEITRRVLNRKNIRYFGPFTSASKDILDSIYELFKLRQKKSCKKRCLFFDIQRCKAPCENYISKEEYREILNLAIESLKSPKLLILKLKKRLDILSNELRFEEAIELRDRLEKIESTQMVSNIDLKSKENLDIFALTLRKTRGVLVKIFIRAGRVISSSYEYIRVDEKFNLNDAYKFAILNLYQREILVNIDSIILADEIDSISELKEFLSQRFNRDVKVISPKRGVKRDLVKLAQKNGYELLKSQRVEDILEEIESFFKLDNYPNAIEIFDTSHLSFENIVGAKVLYRDNSFQKSEYRLYNLDSKSEYEQMQELLLRRVKSGNLPDLWIIDGGRVNLNLAKEIVDSLGVNLDIIAISKERIDAKVTRAKVRAKDKIHTILQEFELNPRDKKLQFIQKLRDEAHRFAISSHKKARVKSSLNIELLRVKNIGKAKLKRLIDYFGYFENIKSASFEELEQVLNSKDAESITKFFIKRELDVKR